MFTNTKKNTIFSLPKIYICTRKKVCQRKKCVKESNIRYVKIIICTGIFIKYRISSDWR